MSKLGAISGELNRERKLLRNLNNALLTVEAASLGKADQFGYSEADITSSKEILLEFATRLRGVLQQDQITSDIQPIIQRIRSSIKPQQDWVEDLVSIERRLDAKASMEEDGLRILEDVLSLLDADFADALSRLYVR